MPQLIVSDDEPRPCRVVPISARRGEPRAYADLAGRVLVDESGYFTVRRQDSVEVFGRHIRPNQGDEPA